MKITETIKQLLEKIDDNQLKPWERGSNPKDWAILKDQVPPETKKCTFCGEEVPLMWEPNFKIIIQEPNFIKNGIDDGRRPTAYKVAKDIHPKCRELEKKFSEWGVSKKRAFEIDNFIADNENKSALVAVDKWLESPSFEGLYLFGPPGVGKTLLATKIILKSETNDKLIITESDIYDSLRPNINDEESLSKTNSFLSELRRKELLIIDDLGTAKNTPWKMETLFAVISKRIDFGLPTFFTSNYHPADLGSRIDGKIVSRVFELSNPCMIGGKDHRLTRKE